VQGMCGDFLPWGNDANQIQRICRRNVETFRNAIAGTPNGAQRLHCFRKGELLARKPPDKTSASDFAFRF